LTSTEAQRGLALWFRCAKGLKPALGRQVPSKGFLIIGGPIPHESQQNATLSLLQVDVFFSVRIGTLEVYRNAVYSKVKSEGVSTLLKTNVPRDYTRFRGPTRDYRLNQILQQGIL